MEATTGQFSRDMEKCIGQLGADLVTQPCTTRNGVFDTLKIGRIKLMDNGTITRNGELRYTNHPTDKSVLVHWPLRCENDNHGTT